jgi:hypothetical protein
MTEREELNVYAIYGRLDDSNMGRQFLTYALGKDDVAAIKDAIDNHYFCRDTSSFKKDLSAVQVKVEGYRVIAHPLEQKVEPEAK